MPLDQTRRAKQGSDWIAPDCSGMDFYAIDRSLQDLLRIYLTEEPLRHFTPHFAEMGQLAGSRLDELARIADRHGPVLHARDRTGRRLVKLLTARAREGVQVRLLLDAVGCMFLSRDFFRRFRRDETKHCRD